MVGTTLATAVGLLVLAYSNQYLVQYALETTPQERDRVLEAATRAFEADRKLHDWRARLAQLKSEIGQVERHVAPSGAEDERKARAADAEC
ncbi:MAG: hypothetical protein H6837_15270 [Planctomycetes bacterium]|nr:hypothetical protein [Planctomycetota bacterium]